jgi:hypothetical protein
VNQSIVNRSARDGHGVVPRTPGKLLPQGDDYLSVSR